MTTQREREAEDEYEARNDPSPVSGTTQDNTYVRTRQGGQIPVRKDQAAMEDPMRPPFSNTDAQLARDENEAINQSNIMRGDRTRHAKPQAGTGYSEGEDEEE